MARGAGECCQERTGREDVREERAGGRADSELLHRLVDGGDERIILVLDLVAVRHHEDDSTSGPAAGTERQTNSFRRGVKSAMTILLDELDKTRGVLVKLVNESTSLGLNQGHKALHVLAATDELEDETAVLPELVAIGEESESPVPADKLAADGDHGTGGVDGRLLLEHIYGMLRRVEDDVGLAEEGYRDDVT